MVWRRVSTWVTVLLAGVVLAFVLGSLALQGPARSFPLGTSLATLAGLLLILAGEFSPRVRRLFEIQLEVEEIQTGTGSDGLLPANQPVLEEEVLLGDVPWRLVAMVFGSTLLYSLGVLLAGFTVATPLFVLLFLRLYGGAGWLGAAALAAGTTGAIVALSQVLRADLYAGVLWGAPLPPF